MHLVSSRRTCPSARAFRTITGRVVLAVLASTIAQDLRGICPIISGPAAAMRATIIGVVDRNQAVRHVFISMSAVVRVESADSRPGYCYLSSALLALHATSIEVRPVRFTLASNVTSSPHESAPGRHPGPLTV